MTFSITLLACDIRVIIVEHILESPFLVLVHRLLPLFWPYHFIQMCWHIAVNTFIASSSTSFNSSMGRPIKSEPCDFPFDIAFKAFLTSSSNTVAYSSHSYVSYIVVMLPSRLYKFSV